MNHSNISSIKHYLRTIIVPILALLLASSAYGQLTIEITQGVDSPVPIAVVPFAAGGQNALPEDVAEIINANLRRSGLFRPIPRGGHALLSTE